MVFFKEGQLHWKWSYFFETESFYYALTNAHVVDKHQDFENHIIEVYDYFNNKYNAFVYEGSFNNDLDLAVLVFYKKRSRTDCFEYCVW